MSNDDERDYAEEQHNAHLLDDETDPEDYVPEGYAPRHFRPPGEGTYTKSDHRTQALADADMASRSDPEFAPGLGFAALTHAVLALSAPASPEEGGAWHQRVTEAEAALITIGGIIGNADFVPVKRLLEDIERVLRESRQRRRRGAQTPVTPAVPAPEHEPDDTWRQRAIEAEAALTAIGGILGNPGYPGNKLEEAERILRTAGREADRLMNAPAAQGSALNRIRTESQVRAFLAEQLDEDTMSLDEIAAEVTKIATGSAGYEPR